MIDLDGVQAHVLVRCLERFREAAERELGEVLARELRGFRPQEVRELFDELDVMTRQLAVRPNLHTHAPSDPWPNTSVHEVHARMLKRIVVAQRRALAQEIDGPRQLTTHREAILWLERELKVLDQLIEAPWFVETRPARIPRLTDFLSIRHAEALRTPEALPVAPVDDKFRILGAASACLPELARLRVRCELRELAIAVVYLDIDDFKGFNSRYGETRVDRDLLPPFMQLLEAHAFMRGRAYRMGGDEFVVVVPNADRDAGGAFVRRFANALRELRCPGVDPRPTVSAGVVELAPDSFLTEREVLARADRAKAFAKSNGKRRVAGYEGELMREQDLRVLDQPSI
jgi:diguanylate cyclase (GGDEF)-like protein